MDQTKPARNIWRTVWALLAGFLTVVILSIGADIVMRALSLFPKFGPMSDSFFVIATVYRTVFGVAGSYITARLAPYEPMQHALLGGVIGLVLSLIGAITTWSRGAEFGPHWYPVALVLLAMPTAWAGGKLRLMQLGSRAA